MNRPRPDPAPLGLFGGTFDPIHGGHLRLAEEAREALALDGVRFVPAGVPPHRDTPASSGEHRLEMVRRAIAGNPAFTCDDGEIRAAGPSYTVLTLERLRAELPERPLVLLLGADAFVGLPDWHRWREILELAHIAVANRPGHAIEGTPAALAPEFRARRSNDPSVLRTTPAGRIVQFEMTPLAISATTIRELVRAGRSPRYLLPDSVVDYISAHSLYR